MVFWEDGFQGEISGPRKDVSPKRILRILGRDWLFQEECCLFLDNCDHKQQLESLREFLAHDDPPMIKSVSNQNNSSEVCNK